jgi:hypothetical protein
VAIEFRWADDENDRLPELATDLVRHRVAVIATPGSLATPIAAKAATPSIPIVFCAGWGSHPLRPDFRGQRAYPGSVASRLIKAGNQSDRHWVFAREDYRDAGGCRLSG